MCSSDLGLNVHIVFHSNNIIHADLLDSKGNHLSITFIYGHPENAKRGEVWNQLRNFKNLAHQNWLCIGDFNQIMYKEEKFSFNMGSIVGANLFQQVISELHLCNLVANGQKFTWMNNREEEGFRRTIIGALGNDSRILVAPNAKGRRGIRSKV